MRSLLLASAAVLLTTGIACAQMSSSAPGAAGSAGAPMAQPGAPGGKTAPNNAAPAVQGSMGSGSMTNSNTMSSSSSSSTSPSYNGQDSVTNGESPSTQTGTLGQKAANANMGAMGSGSHHWSSGAMPENGDARTYLRIARMDIQHHNRAGADEALSRAETRVLTRSVPAAGAMTDESPMVTAIENARQAVNAGNYQQAAVDTDMAMHHHMQGGMGMGTDVDGGGATATNASVPSPHAIENGNNPNAAAPSAQQ